MLSTSAVFLAVLAAGSQAMQLPPSNSPFAARSGVDKVDFIARRAADPFANGTIINSMNTEYLTKVEVAGHNFTLVLDTGSSDLWVYPTRNDLAVKNQTETFVNITYGSGSVAGTIAYGSVVFSNHTIDNQVFLNVNLTDDVPIEGILGLGFDTNSAIYNATGNNSADATPLTNVFNQNKTDNNFITLDLSRGTDGGNTIGGAFTINRYLADQSAVANAPRNNVTPPDSRDWSIAVGGVNVNGQEYNISQDAVNGTTHAVIDSGTSFAIVPTNLSNFIYQGIPGAKSCPTDSGPMWVVPCTSASNLTFTFRRVSLLSFADAVWAKLMRGGGGISGQQYPVNPLDLTTLVTFSANKTRYTACLGVYTSAAVLTTNTTDLPFYLLGDIFMRNVYSAFNFGSRTTGLNSSTPANIQFLSKTNASTAYTEFVNIRNQTIQELKSKAVDPSTFDCSTLDAFAADI
ncbi:acid protease [Dentipellis sp. KUC8613]|nr:acid protease [Dentipellis sp. KUC8613]